MAQTLPPLDGLLGSGSVFPVEIQVVKTMKGLRFHTLFKLTVSLAQFSACGRKQETHRVETKDVITHSSSSSHNASICSLSPNSTKRVEEGQMPPVDYIVGEES